MNISERLEAFWSGEKPDHIPYTIYENSWKYYKDDPAWQEMYKNGLGVIWHLRTYKKIMTGVERTEKTYSEAGKQLRRITYHTSVGDLYEIKMDIPFMDEWTMKYILETPEDYRVMTHIVENTRYKSNYEQYVQFEKSCPEYVVPTAWLPPTPLQEILVDMAGLENFAFHLYDYEDEMMSLYSAHNKKYEEQVDIVASGPGRFVSVMDNFTAESMGPDRFAKYTIPIYEKCFPIMRQTGKIVGNHYDGRLASCAKIIAKAPFDLIESLTPPPEGDMELDECRRLWPDKLFWVNIRVSDYTLPEKKLENLVGDMVRKASDNGKKLAFEVSEDVPVNWKESIPVVLKALNEI
jgi:hypothetical protein